MTRSCIILMITLITLAAGGDQESCATSAITAAPFPVGDSLDFQIVGRDCRWEMIYPGRDGLLGTPDDIEAGNRCQIPAGIPVRISLKSTDFIYSFALSELNLREVAVPDLEFTLTLSPLTPGQLTFHGGEMCGDQRNELSGTVVVQSLAEWNTWLQQIEGRHD